MAHKNHLTVEEVCRILETARTVPGLARLKFRDLEVECYEEKPETTPCKDANPDPRSESREQSFADLIPSKTSSSEKMPGEPAKAPSKELTEEEKMEEELNEALIHDPEDFEEKMILKVTQGQF